MNKNNNIFSTKQVFEHALKYISTSGDYNTFDISATDVADIEMLIMDLDTIQVHYGMEGYFYKGGMIQGDSRTAHYTRICDVNGSPLWRYDGWGDVENNNVRIFDEQDYLSVSIDTDMYTHKRYFTRVSRWDSYDSISDVIDELNRDIADLDYDDDEGYRRLTKEVVALSEATNLKQVLAIITPEEKDGGFNEVIKTISESRNSINEIIVNMYGTLIRLHVDNNCRIIYPTNPVFSDEQIQLIYIEYEDGTCSVSREEEKVTA